MTLLSKGKGNNHTLQTDPKCREEETQNTNTKQVQGGGTLIILLIGGSVLFHFIFLGEGRGRGVAWGREIKKEYYFGYEG